MLQVHLKKSRVLIVLNSDYAIILEESGDFQFQIQNSFIDVLATLQPGQKIIIEGIGSGNYFSMKDCRIIQILD